MGSRVRVEHEYGASNAGGDLFEHLQPLPDHLEIDEHEASDVPAGCAKLETKPCSTGSLTAAITIGMELVACRRAWMTGVPWPTITSGPSATSSAA